MAKETHTHSITLTRKEVAEVLTKAMAAKLPKGASISVDFRLGSDPDNDCYNNQILQSATITATTENEA